MRADRGPPPAWDWPAGRSCGPGRSQVGSDERLEDLAELLGYVGEAVADEGSNDPSEAERPARTPLDWPSCNEVVDPQLGVTCRCDGRQRAKAT